jgi:hypothetical protein
LQAIKSAIKAEPTGGVLRVLNSMIGEAREFIEASPDAEDKEAMSEILDELQELLEEETTEGDKSLKAEWSAAFINELPDSSFLYIEDGGEKDGDGKTTPRSLRHFPVKDSSGKVDMPHLRNALSRIPQSNLPGSVKDRITAAAERMMAAMKSSPAIEESDEEPVSAKSRSQDPLRRQGERLAFQIGTGDLDLPPPPEVKEAPKPELSVRDLRRKSHDLMLELLTD